MDFPREIYEAHRQLSQCSVKFIEFVRNNPEGLRRSHFDAIVNHPIFNYYRMQPWPTFVNRKMKQELKIVCMKVFNLIKSIPRRFFNYDFGKISQYFEIPVDRCRQLFEGVDDEYLAGMLGRGDFVISPTGGIKCIEYNTTSNLGGNEQDFLEEVYTRIPVISRFLSEYRIKIRNSRYFVEMIAHILESAVEWFGSNPEGEINTAFVMEGLEREVVGFAMAQLKQMYKEVLKNIDNSLNGEMFCIDVKSLKPVGNSVYYRERPIHAIIEWCRGRVHPPVINAVKSGSLLLYNGPVQEIMCNKLTISVLSEHENSDLFSAGEKETVNKYIPWTRKLIPGITTYETTQIRLEDFVLTERERLELKAVRGYGGYEVIMGAQTSSQQWKQSVEKALLEKKWVVQEYIKPQSYLYQAGETGCVPHQVVWGVFMFGARSPGGFVRVLPEQSSSRVINLNQGAEQSIIIEVEE